VRSPPTLRRRSPINSLLALLAVEFARLVPLGLAGKLWYDGIVLAAVGIALYFLTASVRFGVGTINV